MLLKKVIRRCLLPAAAVVVETKLTQPKEVQNQSDSYTCRPSELPIYTEDPPLKITEQGISDEQTPNFIENSVKSVRETLGRYSEEFHAYERVAKQSLSDSKQNVEWLIDYLRQEDNTLPKAGAIGIGALTGFIFGLRGGFFKRTIYTTTGAFAMAAICYPKEASEYAEIGAVEGKKYLTIAYNFAYGDDAATSKMEEVKNVTNVSSKPPTPFADQDPVQPPPSYANLLPCPVPEPQQEGNLESNES